MRLVPGPLVNPESATEIDIFNKELICVHYIGIDTFREITVVDPEVLRSIHSNAISLSVQPIGRSNGCAARVTSSPLGPSSVILIYKFFET